MANISINNRPFASDFITGLMLPDGIFEASLGLQQLNAHFTNTGGTAQTNLNIYVESVSHPSIIVTPVTYFVSKISSGATSLKQWEINVSSAPAGVYYVSYIAENASGRQRIIKKIFVTRVTYNSADHTFSAECPEGTFKIQYREISKVSTQGCCCNKKDSKNSRESKNPF